MAGKEVVLVTGAGGYIGKEVVAALAARYDVVGFDRPPVSDVPGAAAIVPLDITVEASVREGLAQVRYRFGGRIASVIHLAAYFDLSGEPNSLYEAVTVEGTRRLLYELQPFEVEQFVYISTMLVHAAGRPGERVSEERPLDPKLPYRASKVRTEALVRAERGSIPVVLLRPSGIYDDRGHNTFLAHQIARIYERRLTARVYPGDLAAGQSYLHLDDFVDAVSRVVERRRDLPPEMPILLGEPEAIGYGALQRRLGGLLHGEPWETHSIPFSLAKTGAWVETEVLGEQPFIRPWMVDIASDHYELDVTRARELLDWSPKHRLRETLPAIVAAIKADPAGWYEENRLNAARVASRPAADHVAGPHSRAGDGHADEMQEHMAEMKAMQQRMLWTQWLIIALGAWLLTSPFQYGLFDPDTAQMLRDVTAERGLWDPALRNALTGWSDLASGALLMVFGALALSSRFVWAQWSSCVIGLWLLFAPLIFWTPSAAAYMNDMAVGTLVIALSVLIPMMPGMSHEGMMDDNTIPAGWTYSPSSWHQRLPIIALGFFGFLLARYLSAFQMGHVGSVWEPFFAGQGGQNGTEYIITSDVSRAWPVADAGLGATAYMLEALMGAMGSAKRWRTMPWMVTFFFILVVPLGGVSIFFIIIQPILIGTYCTLCLIQAFAMLVMIPFAIDEVIAMGQYMRRAVAAGQPFWRTFLRGGPDPAGQTKREPGFDAPLARQIEAAAWGVTIPWTLVASCLVGTWMMFSRLVFDTAGPIADNDHVVGAIVLTIAVIAMAEVVRPLRFVNALTGLWLVAAPWLLADGLVTAGAWNDVVAGLIIFALSLPRGKRSSQHYGSWDRYVV